MLAQKLAKMLMHVLYMNFPQSQCAYLRSTILGAKKVLFSAFVQCCSMIFLLPPSTRRDTEGYTHVTPLSWKWAEWAGEAAGGHGDGPSPTGQQQSHFLAHCND